MLPITGAYKLHAKFFTAGGGAPEVRRSRILIVMLLGGLAVYTGVLISRASYVVHGSDSSGYANLARSLLSGQVVLPVPELEQLDLPAAYTPLFTPLAYIPGLKDGNPAPFLTPIYPVGFPLHIAIAASIFGWARGPFWISPLAAAASLLLMVAVGRRLGLSSGFAIAGAVILAVNPTFIFMALQPMSDVTATAWALAMAYAGLRSRQDDRWAPAAGAAFGVALLVRPTNILLLAPLVFCLQLKPRSLLLFGLGGVPMAAVFFGFNYAAYGRALQTGYGTANLGYLVTTVGSGARLEHYIRWISTTMSPLLLPGWLAVALVGKIEWRNRALLIAWFGAFFGFYVCYNVYDDWWFTRFLLPGYPGLILGATSTASSLLALLPAERPWLRLGAGLVPLLLAIGVPMVHDSKLGVFRIGEGQSIHVKACRMAEAQLPTRSLVISGEMSGAMKFYTRRSILRWEAIGPELWRKVLPQILEKGYSLSALLMDHEVETAQSRVIGEWTEMGRIGPVSLWRIDPTALPRSDMVFASGFSNLEINSDGLSWRWMGDEGVILLPNTGRNMLLTIRGVVPIESLPGPPTFRIAINGRVLDEALAQRTFLKEFLVTAAQQGDQAASELRIMTNQVFVPAERDPGNHDRRRLGFSLIKLAWREAPRTER